MNRIARATEFLPTNIESSYEFGPVEWLVFAGVGVFAVAALVFALLLLKNFSKYKSAAAFFTSLFVFSAGAFICLISAGSMGNALMTDLDNQENVRSNIEKAYDVESVSDLDLKEEGLYTAEVKIKDKFVTVSVTEDPKTFEPTLSTTSITDDELDLLKIKK